MEPDLKPFQLVYAFVAMAGGIARYLNSFIMGRPFKISVLLASGFVSGFSGLMFALLGDSLSLPYPMPYVMAGVGGFFGDQTMKFLMEFTTKRAK